MINADEDLRKLKKQLANGSIRRAYQSILTFVRDLRTFMIDKYPTYDVSAIYQGYLDMTYFAVVPGSLKEHGLKVAIVFNYDSFRFEAWLAARNRAVQKKYWEVFRTAGWKDGAIMEPAKGVDAIIVSSLTEEMNTGDTDWVIPAITARADDFIRRVGAHLAAIKSNVLYSAGRDVE